MYRQEFLSPCMMNLNCIPLPILDLPAGELQSLIGTGERSTCLKGFQSNKTLPEPVNDAATHQPNETQSWINKNPHFRHSATFSSKGTQVMRQGSYSLLSIFRSKLINPLSN